MKVNPGMHIPLLSFLFIVTLSFTACQKEIETPKDEEPDEFFTLRVDSTTHTWVPPYHMYAMEDTDTHGIGYYYNMVGANDTIVWSRSIQLVILRPENNPTSLPYHFDIESIIVYDQTAPQSFQGYFFPLLVSQAEVTEFDPIGGYISGNFSGTYIKSTISVPEDTVFVSCSWRTKREPF